jgi:hypothetical protein
MTQKPNSSPLSGNAITLLAWRKQCKSGRTLRICWSFFDSKGIVDQEFLQAKWLTSITTGRFCNIWGSKSNKNVQNDRRTKTSSFIMTAHWHTLLYQCCNFWPLKTWLWSPTLLIRLIWPLVASCIREWNHS